MIDPATEAGAHARKGHTEIPCHVLDSPASLLEFNEICLRLLTEQAAVRNSVINPTLRQMGDRLRVMGPPAYRRMASAPCLLLDASFSDATRWRRQESFEIHDGASVRCAPFFTVPRAAVVMRMIFNYAWNLVHFQNHAARLILGMSEHSMNIVRSCSLPRMHELADLHLKWLRPQWSDNPRFWRTLLQAAASDDAVALERAHAHGLQLLAAEARSSTPMSG